MQKSGRLRLRPWLEEQIQSGKYPGVSWLDQSAQVFQIPWKHAARHGWSIDQDATLFRSWAMHTGRYHPGKDQPDPKTWKANFRCALNSLTDIRELQEQSRKRGSNAYRVYRMLPSKQTHRRGLRLSNITRVSQKCPGDEAQIINISNAEHSACALHATQHSTSEPTSDATNTGTNYPLNQGGPCVKVEFPAEELYNNNNNNNNNNTTTHGLWEIRQEDKEQTEAVFKLVDHLSNTELWSQSEEQRIWRTHTLWNHWPCGAGEDCLYTLQADSYLPWTETSDSIGEYYMKESSDWSTLQHLLAP